jgi:hypothetical protein
VIQHIAPLVYLTALEPQRTIASVPLNLIFAPELKKQEIGISGIKPQDGHSLIDEANVQRQHWRFCTRVWTFLPQEEKEAIMYPIHDYPGFESPEDFSLEEEAHIHASEEREAGGSSQPARLQNLSLLGIIPPDSRSPLTPDDPVGQAIYGQYTHPAVLPPALRSSEDRSFFGAVQVPAGRAAAYMEVRQHMAEGGARAQKYLAALEERFDGMSVEVYPYEGSSPISRLGGRELLPAETQVRKEGNTILVTFSTNEAMLHLTGSASSPATAAAHELAHAARDGEDRNTELDLKLEGWTNAEEHHVSLLENVVAKAHNEAQRDAHQSVVTYRTINIKSTTPANPTTAKIIEHYRPKFQELTQRMDDLKLTHHANPNHDIVIARKELAIKVGRLIHAAEAATVERLPQQNRGHVTYHQLSRP